MKYGFSTWLRDCARQGSWRGKVAIRLRDEGCYQELKVAADHRDSRMAESRLHRALMGIP